MKNNTRRILALVLALTMILSIAAVPTFAAEEETRTVYFSNNQRWETVYVHYWVEDGDGTDWPGEEAEYIGYNGYNEGIYSFDVPTWAEKIIFSAGDTGDNSKQTVDIVLADYTADGFYPDGTSEDGKYNVSTYDFDPSGITQGELEDSGDNSTGGENLTRDVTLVLKNSANWDEVWVYYWPIGGENFNWPGEKLTPADDGLYYAVIPAGNGMVIFNNGDNGEQTADLVVPTDDNVLYDNLSDSWSKMVLDANNPDGSEDDAPKMTFLQKMAKALLIFLREIEYFFKNLFVKK